MIEEACDGCRELEEKVELMEERLLAVEDRLENLQVKYNKLLNEIRKPKPSNAVKSSSNIYAKNPHKRP